MATPCVWGELPTHREPLPVRGHGGPLRDTAKPQLPDEDLQRALQCGGFGCTALLAEASPTSQGHAAGDGECDDGARRNDEGQRHAIAAAQGTTGRRRRTRATGRSASRRCRDGLGMINSATANVRAAALMTAPVAHQSP